MPDRTPSPLQAGCWLTGQEKRGILVICALLLLGIAARYYYLKTEKPKPYTPPNREASETASVNTR